MTLTLMLPIVALRTQSAIKVGKMLENHLVVFVRNCM